jgi:hypothetical protein
VCGGRKYRDDRFVDYVLTKLPITHIIHGAAAGADTLAREWAEAYGIEHHPFPAQWDKYGKRAGFLRNRQMIAEGKPDLVVAFRGGRGTQDMITQSKKYDIPVIDL